MCPNLDFASSAAFRASLDRIKQLGTEEKLVIKDKAQVGQQMDKGETICFM